MPHFHFEEHIVCTGTFRFVPYTVGTIWVHIIKYLYSVWYSVQFRVRVGLFPLHKFFLCHIPTANRIDLLERMLVVWRGQHLLFSPSPSSSAHRGPLTTLAPRKQSYENRTSLHSKLIADQKFDRKLDDLNIKFQIGISSFYAYPAGP
jgi:hypothetical protein